ncbi:hypothetical protein V6N11_081086 [Hibiscus sabdariffa]|uniref:Interferon-related developmental regulator N-terminal domain-containing protein n=1 Tax=Hibiscus sabdariffa TaxID=183260 RepID=A0ABR2QIT2_9ROSI
MDNKRRNRKGSHRPTRTGILLDDDASADLGNFRGHPKSLQDYSRDLSEKSYTICLLLLILKFRFTLASLRQDALSSILKALTVNIEQKFVEQNFVTLVYQCLHPIKKGSPKEMKQAAHIIGLLSMITTSVDKVHEAYEDVLTALSQGELKSKLKTLEITGCLAVVTFFGASNSDETEQAMKLLWDFINPEPGHTIERKDSPAILSAAISAWTFLLSTIDGWRLDHKSWKGAISYFSNLLDSNDETACTAACEALALIFETNCLKKFSTEVKDFHHEGDTSIKIHPNTELKENIIKQLRRRLIETSNENTPSQNPNTGFNSVSAALNFLEDGKCLNSHVTIGGQKLTLSTWSQIIQLKFLQHFLGKDGFTKHMMENENFHNVFDFIPKRRNPSARKLYIPEREEVTIRFFQPPVPRHQDCSLLPFVSREEKQLEKKMTMSPNSHLSKARTRLLRKQRQLLSKERESDCFGFGDEFR